MEPSLPPFLRGIVTLRDSSKYEVEFLPTGEQDADGCHIYSYAAPAEWADRLPPRSFYLPWFPERTAVQIEVNHDD